MKAYKKFGLLSAILVLGAMLVASGNLLAQFPNEPGTEKDIPSLGMYRISIVEKFLPYFSYYPSGWNPATGKLESPTLYDGDTRIGYSGQLTHNQQPQDSFGVIVGGSDSIMIGDTIFKVPPPNWQGPDGRVEIHLELRSMKMNLPGGGAPKILAGRMRGCRVSPGEVESLHGDDLPGESFFNVFVEVHIRNYGKYIDWGNDMVVYNKTALLVQSDSLNYLPPRLVYTHGNSTAVPVYFKNYGTKPGFEWNEGDLLGYIVLSGHGINFDDSPEDMAEFDSIMGEQEEMPLQGRIPTLTEWGLIIFCALLFGWMAWVLVRRRRRVTTGA